MSIAERIPAFAGPPNVPADPRSATQLKGPAAAPRPATSQRALPRRKWRGEHVFRNIVLGLTVPLALLLAWQLGTQYGWVPEQILPAPSVVWDTMAAALQDGSLFSDTTISLARVARGFALGGAVGLLLGAGLALSARLRDYVDPLFLAVSQVPLIGWIPLVIMLVGIDEALKTIIIALATFIPVTFGTYQGIRDVPASYREIGQVFTFDRRDTFRLVILPAALPAIFTGLREGLSNGWQTLVAVELLASTEGLGYQMAYGRQLFQLELVITAMIVIGLIGFLFDWVLGRIAQHLQRWQVPT